MHCANNGNMDVKLYFLNSICTGSNSFAILASEIDLESLKTMFNKIITTVPSTRFKIKMYNYSTGISE